LFVFFEFLLDYLASRCTCITHGIIEESVSEWAEPIVIVSKKDSQEVHICVDFRDVDKLANVDPYPLPRVEGLIDKMARAKYITTMDLSRSYWQIPLFKDSKGYSICYPDWAMAICYNAFWFSRCSGNLSEPS